MPANHHDVSSASIKLRPVLGFWQGFEVYLDVDARQHGGDRLCDLVVVHVAVVRGHHGDGEAVFVAGFFHQFLGFFNIEARLQAVDMSLVTFR